MNLSTVDSKEARRLFEDQYYAAVDRLDMETAVTAMHEDVEFDHVQVWQQTDLGLGASRLHGRTAMLNHLNRSKERFREARIVHCIDEFIYQDGKAALLGHVESREDESRTAPFIIWLEFEDGLIRRYIVRPLDQDRLA